MKAAWRNSYYRQCALIREVSDHSERDSSYHAQGLTARGTEVFFLSTPSDDGEVTVRGAAARSA